MNGYSAYEFFGIVVPGGSIVAVAFYGWFGWPYPEPGATALVGILALAFVTGTANNAAAARIQSIWLGQLPWHDPDPFHGLFGPNNPWPERGLVEQAFRDRLGHPELGFEQLYRVSQARLRQDGKAETLDHLNQQITLHRGMALASLICTSVVCAYGLLDKDHLPVFPWVPLLLLGTLLFALGFRRFWCWYGQHVVRNVLALPIRPGT
jgi:hypothetical protein